MSQADVLYADVNFKKSKGKKPGKSVSFHNSGVDALSPAGIYFGDSGEESAETTYSEVRIQRLPGEVFFFNQKYTFRR